MLSWPARGGRDSRVYKCIKEMKWELQWANLVKRATILAMAQGVRVRWPRLFGQIFRLDKWIVCRG